MTSGRRRAADDGRHAARGVCWRRVACGMVAWCAVRGVKREPCAVCGN